MISENERTAWIFGGLPHFPDNGWFNYSLPKGTTPGRELFRMYWLPQSQNVRAFSLSQSKLAQRPLRELGAKRLYRDSADVVLALDSKRIVVVSSEAMMDSSTPEGYTLIAAALIDITKRSKTAAPGAALPQRVMSRGERIGVARFGNRLLIAEVDRSKPFAYSYDFQRNRIGPLTKGEFNPPVMKGKIPVVPKLYDFRAKRAFYDFVNKSEIPARMWTEWDAPSRRWRRFRIPPGEPGAVFYFRGMLYAQAWDSKSVIRLYRASANRRSWIQLGPWKVIARNVSESAWLVQRTTDGKVYVARL